MADKQKDPENIVRIVDLISTIIRRIQKKRLDKSPDARLYMANQEGVAT